MSLVDAHRLDDVVHVFFIVGIDRDIAHDRLSGFRQHLDTANTGTHISDGGEQARQRTGFLRIADTHRPHEFTFPCHRVFLSKR